MFNGDGDGSSSGGDGGGGGPVYRSLAPRKASHRPSVKVLDKDVLARVCWPRFRVRARATRGKRVENRMDPDG